MYCTMTSLGICMNCSSFFYLRIIVLNVCILLMLYANIMDFVVWHNADWLINVCSLYVSTLIQRQNVACTVPLDIIWGTAFPPKRVGRRSFPLDYTTAVYLRIIVFNICIILIYYILTLWTLVFDITQIDWLMFVLCMSQRWFNSRMSHVCTLYSGHSCVQCIYLWRYCAFSLSISCEESL